MIFFATFIPTATNLEPPNMLNTAISAANSFANHVLNLSARKSRPYACVGFLASTPSRRVFSARESRFTIDSVTTVSASAYNMDSRNSVRKSEADSTVWCDAQCYSADVAEVREEWLFESGYPTQCLGRECWTSISMIACGKTSEPLW